MEKFVTEPDENHDIYTEEGLTDFFEEEQLSPEEEAFMFGYISS